MRPEKQFLVDEIKGYLDQFDSFVIMRYLGLTANALGDFRCKIAELGGDIEMVRKRLLVKAASEAGFELEIESLPGHIGLVFANKDAVQTAKAVFELSKNSGNAIEVLGGRIDGQFYSADKVEAFSKLPGKDEMRGQLLGVFEAPMSHTVAAMDALLCGILFCLENRAKGEGVSS